MQLSFKSNLPSTCLTFKHPQSHLSHRLQTQRWCCTRFPPFIADNCYPAEMGWPASSNPSTLSEWLSQYISITPEARNALKDIEKFTTPQLVFVGLACSTSFVIGWKLAQSNSSFKRITSIADISSSNMGPDAPLLRGRVVSVSDGDTFRLLHVPTRFHSSNYSGDRKLSDVSLPIRICTIDTPETAKFGKPGQPYGDEAKDHLKAMMMGRIVKVRLLEKDQYGRGVAEVYRPGPLLGWPKKYMDQEMLKVSIMCYFLCIECSSVVRKRVYLFTTFNCNCLRSLTFSHFISYVARSRRGWRKFM